MYSTTVFYSRAIAIYLVETYGKDDSLYPKDLQQRAIVNQRLYFDHGVLYTRVRAICVSYRVRSYIRLSIKENNFAKL